MLRNIVLLVLIGVSIAQWPQPAPCGFSCTRRASFFVNIDGVFSQAICARNNCEGCCSAFALHNEIDSVNSASFPSTDGRSCVCCTTQHCFNGRPPVIAVERPPNGNFRTAIPVA